MGCFIVSRFFRYSRAATGDRRRPTEFSPGKARCCLRQASPAQRGDDSRVLSCDTALFLSPGAQKASITCSFSFDFRAGVPLSQGKLLALGIQITDHTARPNKIPLSCSNHDVKVYAFLVFRRISRRRIVFSSVRFHHRHRTSSRKHDFRVEPSWSAPKGFREQAFF